jgi:hypothetical protein
VVNQTPQTVSNKYFSAKFQRFDMATLQGSEFKHGSAYVRLPYGLTNEKGK